MRKILSAFVFALILVFPAFSQIRMNGWGRVVWVPIFMGQDEELRSTVQASYGEQPDLEFMFTASSTNIGVDVGVVANMGTFNQIGNAKVWVKPNRYSTLHLGMGRVPALRGTIASSTGSYAYARGRLTGLTASAGTDSPIVMINDGDGIFSRFNLSKMGAILEVTPIDGLYIGAAFAPEYTPNSGHLAEDVYKGLHTAVGYTVNNVGLIRVGFIGGGSETDISGKVGNAGQNWDFSWDRRIEAAFALTMVPHLDLDFGVKYSLEKVPGILEQPGFSLGNPLYVALGVNYSGIEKIKLGFAIDGHFAGNADSHSASAARPDITSAPQVAFNVYPTYDIGLFDLGADIAFGMQFGDKEGINDKKMLGFGIHAHKQYNHGNLRGGIYVNAPMNEGQKWGFSVPVWITYSF